jgi:hypothetical protein
VLDMKRREFIALVGGGGLLLAIAATLTPDPPRTNRPRSPIHR